MQFGIYLFAYDCVDFGSKLGSKLDQRSSNEYQKMNLFPLYIFYLLLVDEGRNFE